MAINDQVRTDRGTIRDVSEGRDESLADISATKLLGDDLPSSPSDGQVLRFNGSSGAWEHKRSPVDVFNVKDFGAQGGGADDSQAFIAAKDAAIAAGGVVFVPGGEWRAAGIPVENDLAFRGDGLFQTTIKAPDGTADPVFKAEVGVGGISRVFMRDLTIHGNGKVVDGLDLENADNIKDSRFVDVRWQGCDTGVRGSQDDRVVPFDRCQFRDCNAGYRIFNNHPYFYNCYFRICTHGIEIDGTIAHLPILDSLFEDCDIGIRIVSGSWGASRVLNTRFTGIVTTGVEMGEKNLLGKCSFRPGGSPDADVTAITFRDGTGINHISDCYFEEGFDGGIMETAGAHPSRIKFTDNTVIGQDQLIDVTDEGSGNDHSNWVIAGNFFSNAASNIINTSGKALVLPVVRDNTFVVKEGTLTGQIIKMDATAFGGVFSNNAFFGTNGSLSQSVWLKAASFLVENNYFDDIAKMVLSSINGETRVHGNDAGDSGFITENDGTATVPSGSTSVAVSHGLDATPDVQDISVTPTNDPANDVSNFWISGVTASEFTVNVGADPGSGGATFAWKVEAL